MRDKILAVLADKGLVVQDNENGRYLWTIKGQSCLVMSRAVGGRDSGFSPEDYVDGLALDLYYLFGPDASIVERVTTVVNNYNLTLSSPAADQVKQAFDLMSKEQSEQGRIFAVVVNGSCTHHFFTRDDAEEVAWKLVHEDKKENKTIVVHDNKGKHCTLCGRTIRNFS